MCNSARPRGPCTPAGPDGEQACPCVAQPSLTPVLGRTQGTSDVSILQIKQPRGREGGRPAQCKEEPGWALAATDPQTCLQTTAYRSDEGGDDHREASAPQCPRKLVAREGAKLGNGLA